jgi:Brp/Blh family beta-carotene 15,15'-monooxygenase
MNFWQKTGIVLAAILMSHLIDSDNVTVAVAGLLVLLLGIPHGATDPIIYNVIDSKKLTVKASPAFLVVYIVLIASYLAFWILFPKTSLAFFLLISSYHFGETQFVNAADKAWKKYFLAIVWGTSVLCLMLLAHLDVLQDWLMPIVQSQATFDWLDLNKWVLMGSTTAAAIAAIAIFDRKLLLKESSELILLVLLFNYTDVLIGFAVFFCFWHSWDALLYQLQGLRRIDKKLNLLHFIKKILPYSLISIAALTVFTVLSIFLQFELSWIIVFFVLVALLTLPHSIIISRFYQMQNAK